MMIRMANKNIEKIRLNATSHSVRASQAVLQYGVGAMVDFPSQTLMTAAPEYWNDQIIRIHDERLEKSLGVRYFGMPAGGKNRDGIAYARFPEWYFCPKCRRFQPLSKWIAEFNKNAKEQEKTNNRNMSRRLYCPTDHVELVMARIVTVCERGHINDFPWIKWTHAKSFGGPKPVCANPQLKFTTSPVASEGLEGLSLKCSTCMASATLKDAFNDRIFEQLDERTENRYDFTCEGRHPWKNQTDACPRYPKVLQRGSSSVYFPVTASSLVIPPFSDIINTRVDNSALYEEFRNEINGFLKARNKNRLTADDFEELVQEAIQEYSEKIADNIGCKQHQVREILSRRMSAGDEINYDTGSIEYRAAEFDALSGRASVKGTDYDDFKRVGTDIKKYDIPFVKGISLIEKIREVQVMLGFSRISPFSASMIGDGSSNSNFVSVKKAEDDWYPGYNVYGEGIFIEFDEDAINRWRSGNGTLEKRVKILQENYDKSFIGSQHERQISGKFLLLHTVSHLLIKQLSFECGYNISSLKERIYCGEAAEGKEMAGILIYTASGDSEGTLGGLVRQGRYDTFPRIYRKAIESAVICSNDPVCSLSNGQGRDSLNLAACYSCCLLPETCCEEFNVFLDRGVAVGTYDNKKLGFFHEQLYGTGGWKRDPESLKEKTTETERPTGRAIVTAGTDMSGESSESVISDISQFSETDGERELAEWLKNSGALAGKRMPLRDVKFSVSGNSGSLECDYYWRDSEIMYFAYGQEKSMKIAADNGIKCIYGPDGRSENNQRIIREMR